MYDHVSYNTFFAPKHHRKLQKGLYWAMISSHSVFSKYLLHSSKKSLSVFAERPIKLT